MLKNFADNLRAGAFGERAQLRQGFVGAEFRNARLAGSWGTQGGGIAGGSGTRGERAFGSFCFRAAGTIVQPDQKRPLRVPASFIAGAGGRQTWEPGFCFAQATTVYDSPRDPAAAASVAAGSLTARASGAGCKP